MLQFTRVDSIETTERGLEAALHGERLRIEPVRDDVVRIKLSRGGVFDDAPTHAVIARRARREFTVEGTTRRVRTAQLTVTLRADPFGIDVHRADGTRRAGVHARVRDAQRRVRAPAPLPPRATRSTAWGRRADRGNRTRPRLHALEHRHPQPDRRRRVRRQRRRHRVRPVLRLDPVLLPPHASRRAHGGSFIDNGYRARVRLRARGATRSASRAASTRSTCSPARACRTSSRPTRGSRGAPRRRRCGRSATTSAAGSTTRRTRSRRSARRHRELGVPCDALWLDIEYMDGYRVFTWNTERVPGRARDARSGCDEQGFRVITIIDPGVKYEPGYAVFDQALERDVLCRTEGGDIYIGEVWPGDTAFPDFVTEEGRAWWGELNAAHVQSGLAGIWNDMNEPATGEHPARADALRPRPRLARALPQPVRAADGDGHGRRACATAMPEQRTFVLSRAGFAGIQRYAANWMGDNQSRWDHLWVSIPMANGLRRVRPAVRRRRRRRLPGRLQRASCSCAGCSTARSRRSAATTPRSATSTSTRGRGASAVLDLVREAIAAPLPAAALPLRGVHARVGDRRAGAAAARLRPPGRRRRARHRRPVPARAATCSSRP